MFRYTTILLVAVLLFLINGCGGEGTTANGFPVDKNATLQAQTDTKKLIVPLYRYPYANDNWESLISIKTNYPSLEIIAIVNQSNGDFTRPESPFETGIKALDEAGIKTIGYVYTKKGTRDINEVKQNIDSWVAFYGIYGLRGIFLDECSRLNSDLPYYKTLSSYIKEKGLDIIVLNPGTNVESDYISQKIATIIVTKETTYAKAIAATEFNTPTLSTRLAMILYKSDAPEMAQKSCEYAYAHQFEYMYATDDGFDGNPWDSLASYLEEMAILMRDGCN